MALDIATHTGFCSHDCSGMIDLSKEFCREQALYNFLWELNAAYNLETIAVERVAGQHKNALIVMSRLHGVVRLFAHENDIDVIQFSAGEIKKDFTGKGNAKKPQMIERFKELTGKVPVSDDEADAYALYRLALKQEHPLDFRRIPDEELRKSRNDAYEYLIR